MSRRGSILLLIALLTACAGTGTGPEPTVQAGLPRRTDTTVQPRTLPSVPATTTPEVTTSTLAWASLRVDQEVVVERPQPTTLEIDAIGVVAPVVALGVAPDTGQMEVPDNVDEVGWYQFGPSPGQPGSSVLAAHVDLYGEGPGVFFNLDRLVPGDRIEVHFDAGTTTTFVVTSTERVAKGGLAVDSIFAPGGEPVLRLVTCGGGFDRSSRTYNDNVIVTAQPEVP